MVKTLCLKDGQFAMLFVKYLHLLKHNKTDEFTENCVSILA